jgi:uncharacterized RDD family membrane protein YckC
MSITPTAGWDSSLLTYTPVPPGLQGVGFWPRLGARVIDMIVHYAAAVFAGILFGIMVVVASGGHPSSLVMAKMRHPGITGFFFGLLGAFAYQVVFTTVHGSTLGKLAFSMVVVQEDGSACRFKSALVRELAYFVDALFFGIIAYMAMQRTDQQQRYGDEWAHTIVCKRQLISPEKLRRVDRFILGLFLALIVDSALMMLGFLIVIAG